MGSSVGELVPTHIQRIFLRSGTQRQRDTFVQHIDLGLRSEVSPDVLQKAVDIVTDRHDMLRLICDPVLRIREPGQSVCAVRACRIGSAEDMARCTAEAFDDMSLSEGKIMECILFDSPDGSILRVIINHISVDGVSWNIIVGDLEKAVTALAENRTPELPPRTLPFREHTRSVYAPTASEKEYWSKAPAPNAVLGNGVRYRYDLKIDRQRFVNPYGFEVSEILMTAFARTLRGFVGKDPVVRMESHGRYTDVERTVGWFTCLYPLELGVEDDILSNLYSMRRRRLSVPRNGRAYGQLYPDAPLPRITFNYLSV